MNIDYKKIINSLISTINNKIYAPLKNALFNLNSAISINSEHWIKIFIPFLIICVGFFACNRNQKVIYNNIVDIFSISDDIRAHFSDKPSYWGLSTEYVLENNIISSKYIQNNLIKLDGDKTIKIGQGKLAKPVSPNVNTFDIIIDDLNKSECISYLEMNIPQNNLVKLFSITLINKNTNYTYTWGNTQNSLPVKKYTGRTICSDSNNTIIWTLY
jgi:hypothetical protein